MLQVSSYWREGGTVRVDLCPGRDLAGLLRAARQGEGRRALKSVLAGLMPARVAEFLAPAVGGTRQVATLPDKALAEVAARLHGWEVRPVGTEGWRTAEVTVGGVATQGLSSRTMAARGVEGLYFIGECVDVTGWLGGYNFQWAWASAHAAGAAIRAARQGAG
jgi:predicted flavoprotein YhiN